MLLTSRFIQFAVIVQILVLLSCGDDQQPKSDQSISALTKNDTTELKDTWKVIDSCYAKMLYDNFDLTVRKPLQRGEVPIGKADFPTSIFFDAAMIEMLYDRARVKGFNGIRVYFGRYDSATNPVQGSDYIGKPTIFFVETKRVIGADSVEVFVDQFDGPCKETLDKATNHGHMCPPDPPRECKGAAFKDVAARP